jgi:putative transposase
MCKLGSYTVCFTPSLHPQPHTLFSYPEGIRRAIYTTNAIESLNSVIRKATKKRKLFPHDDAARKVVYLAVQEASKKWTMPIHNWRLALNHFIPSSGTEVIEFDELLSDHI